MRTSVAAPHAAYLRVYQPLAVLDRVDAGRWAEYVQGVVEDVPLASGPPAWADRSRVEGLVASEHLRGLVGLAATPPVVATEIDPEAFVLHVGEQILLAPCQTRLRSLVAFAEMVEGLPAPVASVVVPAAVAGGARAELGALRRDHPDEPVHIRTAGWQVPVDWFVLVDQGEREVRLTEPGRGVVFRTAMVQARRRVARAVRVLRQTTGSTPVTLAVTELGRWLEEFHPQSWVELDYGGLTRLLDDDALLADTSAAEVAAALSALGAGDGARAMDQYQRVAGRWRRVQAYARAS
ncbi:MAG: hypothetical protein ACYCXA_07100 [Actinomycetes bacterium]